MLNALVLLVKLEKNRVNDDVALNCQKTLTMFLNILQLENACKKLNTNTMFIALFI